MDYFGYTTPIGGNPASAAAVWVKNKSLEFTCPGSGQKQVKELGAYVRTQGATGHLRVAIYDTDDNLVCQGDAEITIDNSSAAWKSHTSFTGTTILQGGTKYRLAFSTDNIDVMYYYDAGSAADFQYGLTDYTGGFPATLTGTDVAAKFNVRCGVEDYADLVYQETIVIIPPPGFVAATGGTVTEDGDYKIHTFTEDGTFTVAVGGEVEYLVVGGGGAGGWVEANNAYGGGGGGAGGFRTGTLTVTTGEKTVTVGDGGVGTTSSAGNGEDSVFDSITAEGGGAGARGVASPYPAADGSDGGSGGASVNGGTHGHGEAGQGNDGASSGTSTGASGGGGGASEAGSTEGGTAGGTGGDGLESTISGSSVYYAGGGGGGGYVSGGGAGGNGGGGAGGDGPGASGHTAGHAGTANRGGGGGGGSSSGSGDAMAGGNGGSGIVIIRYRYQ